VSVDGTDQVIPSTGPVTASTPSPSWTRATLLLACAVVIAAVACLAPIGRNDFVRWDDDQTIRLNPLLNPPTSQTLAHAWTREQMNLWVPVTYTAWAGLAWLSRAVGGDEYAPLNPAAFHAASLAAHTLTSGVVFLLLRRLRAGDVPSAIGAALFAVHPVQVEPVAWASGLKDVLCGLLTWTAVWQYVAAAHVGEASPRRRRLHLSLALTAFVLGLLSKPTAMVAPVLALVIDVVVLRRPWWRAVVVLWPAFALSLACATWTSLVQPSLNNAPVPLHVRPFVAADALAFYLCKLIWPARLGLDYGRSPGTIVARGSIACTWLLPLCAALAVGAWARHRRLLVGGAVVFVIGVAPVLGLLRFDFQELSTVADHYLYISMAGAAMAAAEVARRMRPTRAVTIAAPVVIVLATLSWRQAHVWKDSLTLFTHAITVNPDSYAAHNNTASAYLDARKPSLAERHAREALRIKPRYARAMVTLGASLAAQGREDEAADAYRDAIAAQPTNGRAHANLGALLARTGESSDALVHVRRALELNPEDGTAHLTLASLLASTDADRAVHHLREAIRLRPRDARARTTYGRALLGRGQAREALVEFELAMKFDPDALAALYGADDAREMLKQQARVSDAVR
jgi:Tfp pilus assembly protein PilF